MKDSGKRAMVEKRSLPWIQIQLPALYEKPDQFGEDLRIQHKDANGDLKPDQFGEDLRIQHEDANGDLKPDQYERDLHV